MTEQNNLPIEPQDIPTDDLSGGILGNETDRRPEAEDMATGSMSADTAALGGGAIAGGFLAGNAGADTEGGAR